MTENVKAEEKKSEFHCACGEDFKTKEELIEHAQRYHKK